MSVGSSGEQVVLRRGNTMPILGFGTWLMQGETAYEATLTALQTGYRHIDTATVYENERELGRAISESGLGREELFITTKIPPDARSVRQTIERSLANLGIDYVDLWLIHWPPNGANASRTIYEEMLAIRDEGLTRAIGVSNYATPAIDDLEKSTGETPEVNQIPWSPYLYDPTLEHELNEREVVLEGYSPFKQSRLRDSVLADISTSLDVTPAQVVLRWHIQHRVVVIPKSATPQRIVENFDVFNFSIDEESMARLDEVGAP